MQLTRNLVANNTVYYVVNGTQRSVNLLSGEQSRFDHFVIGFDSLGPLYDEGKDRMRYFGDGQLITVSFQRSTLTSHFQYSLGRGYAGDQVKQL